MSYRCVDCGCIFDEPACWVEAHGERLWGCPLCFGAAEEIADNFSEEMQEG